MTDNQIPRPANCGECAKFCRCPSENGDGYCDNWAGVPLRATDICNPNLGAKKETHQKGN